MRIHKLPLVLALAVAGLGAVSLLLLLGNADVTSAVVAAATLVGMYFLRRYARVRLIYDNGRVPAGEDFVPVPGGRRPPPDEGSIADLAERMRGRIN